MPTPKVGSAVQARTGRRNPSLRATQVPNDPPAQLPKRTIAQQLQANREAGRAVQTRYAYMLDEATG